jgi:hypothetical protein
MVRRMKPYPLVDVPQIISKQSHGRGCCKSLNSASTVRKIRSPSAKYQLFPYQRRFAVTDLVQGLAKVSVRRNEVRRSNDLKQTCNLILSSPAQASMRTIVYIVPPIATAGSVERIELSYPFRSQTVYLTVSQALPTSRFCKSSTAVEK